MEAALTQFAFFSQSENAKLGLMASIDEIQAKYVLGFAGFMAASGVVLMTDMIWLGVTQVRPRCSRVLPFHARHGPVKCHFVHSWYMDAIFSQCFYST
jgi:hypothetical protein